MPTAKVSLTPLERHAAFFDPTGTGKVTVGQTYAGLNRLGVKLRYRLVLPVIINFFLGYLTQKKFRMTILVDKIKDGMHPYDSGSFDKEGEIDPAALNTLIAAAKGGPLTNDEFWALIMERGNRKPEMGKLADVLGKWFSKREVRLFFCLAADKTKLVDGKEVPAVSERTLRLFYEGKLLHALARRRRIKDAREARR